MTRTVRLAAFVLPLSFLSGPLAAQDAPAASDAPAAATEGTTIAHGVGVFGLPELPGGTKQPARPTSV